jgi:hypothetical protein
VRFSHIKKVGMAAFRLYDAVARPARVRTSAVVRMATRRDEVSLADPIVDLLKEAGGVT